MKVISEVFSDVAKIWDYSFIGKSNHRNMIHKNCVGFFLENKPNKRRMRSNLAVVTK